MFQSRTEAKTQTITGLLTDDHHIMEAMLEAFLGQLKEICTRQSPQAETKARDLLKQLVTMTNIHTLCEEQALFPVLGAYYPLPVLEIEHDEIMLARASLVLKTLQYSFPEDCNERIYKQGLTLLEQLRGHWRKEEQFIFPLVEQSLSAEEKYKVLAEMQKLRAGEDKVVDLGSPYAQNRFYPFRFPLGSVMLEKIRARTIAREGKLQVKTVDLQAGTSIGTHWSSMQVVLLIYEGEAIWRSRDTSLLLKKGDGILMDPKLPHSLTAQQDTSFLMLLFHAKEAEKAT